MVLDDPVYLRDKVGLGTGPEGPGWDGTGRTAPDRIGEVDGGSDTRVQKGLDVYALEEVTSRAHEGHTGTVLLVARVLAKDHQGVTAPHMVTDSADPDGVGILVEAAEPAVRMIAEG
jgi:hypothetical protein